MSRIAELLSALAAGLRLTRDASNALVFRDVRAELDRYDLGDLVQESTRTPAARVCFLRGKPIAQTEGRIDQDVSIAVIVVAGREGRATPDFASADIAALRLCDAVAFTLVADPYVGLVKLGAAEIGDQLVAVSEQMSGKGLAIAVIEVKWRLYDVAPPRQALLESIGLAPGAQTQIALNGNDPQPPLVGDAP